MLLNAIINHGQYAIQHSWLLYSQIMKCFISECNLTVEQVATPSVDQFNHSGQSQPAKPVYDTQSSGL